MNNENSKLLDCINEISESYEKYPLTSRKSMCKLPNRQIVVDITKKIRELLFLEYYGNKNVDKYSIPYYVGETLLSIKEPLMNQIMLAIIHRSKNSPSEYSLKNDADAGTLAENYAFDIFEAIPKIREFIVTDVEATFQGDPAATDKDEIIFSYPGIFAISLYRIAHEFYKRNIPYIPRIITEYAHSKTGIDIHAGAQIGKDFFIDHGTGVVIGETTVIGDNVKIYQGVTLGALSTKGGQRLKGKKRHPSIEDNVTIYSGATVLGGETVIGKNSVIGGNAFVVASVPEGTKVNVRLEINYS